MSSWYVPSKWTCPLGPLGLYPQEDGHVPGALDMSSGYVPIYPIYLLGHVHGLVDVSGGYVHGLVDASGGYVHVLLDVDMDVASVCGHIHCICPYGLQWMYPPILSG